MRHTMPRANVHSWAFTITKTHPFTTHKTHRIMAQITLQGNPINTAGELPAVGVEAPDFNAVNTDLSAFRLSDLRGSKVVLNIFPSVDTGVCAASVRRFNTELSNLEGVQVVCVSKDLPFAQARFCGAEGLDKVKTVSLFRNGCFERGYGLGIADGALRGLLARAVVVIDEAGKIIYTELVPEITQDPNFDAALAALK